MSKKILKFSASWCAPCKALTQQLAGEDLGAPVQEVDIDENTELTKQYNIRGVPTLVLIDGDVEVKRMSGFATAAKVKETLGL